MNLKQILFIGGGTSFNSYETYLENLKNSPINYERLKPVEKWRDSLAAELPGVDVLLPDFPNKQNAHYDEWKIMFEKILPFLRPDTILIGYSLGAMFLAKYLHESPLAKPLKSLVLIAPGYNDDSNEDLGSFEVISAVGIERSVGSVYLLHSEDDPVVPFTEMAKFQKDIPTARSHVFQDRNHFFQPTFPELVEIIRSEFQIS